MCYITTLQHFDVVRPKTIMSSILAERDHQNILKNTIVISCIKVTEIVSSVNGMTLD